MFGGVSIMFCKYMFSCLSQIILFCSCGEMSFCLPGKVSCCDVDFLECKQKVFQLSLKVVFKTQSPRSRLSGSEISVPGKTFHPIWMQCNLSVIFMTRRDLANKLVEMFSWKPWAHDNFCLYEQVPSLSLEFRASKKNAEDCFLCSVPILMASWKFKWMRSLMSLLTPLSNLSRILTVIVKHSNAVVEIAFWSFLFLIMTRTDVTAIHFMIKIVIKNQDFPFFLSLLFASYRDKEPFGSLQQHMESDTNICRSAVTSNACAA